MKRLFFIATMVVACWLMASDAKPPVEAQGNSNPGVLPPNSHAFGRSYGEWSAAAWQYLLAIPASINLPRGGRRLRLQQRLREPPRGERMAPGSICGGRVAANMAWARGCQ
jgi:hypothetical protein